jgi:hypothetical protein
MRTRARIAVAIFALATPLAAAVPALAAPVAPESATPVQREQASARFKAGKDLMDQGKFPEALQQLRESLDIVASPTTRLLVARCLVKMGKLVEGYAELGRTIVEGKELAASDPRYEKAAQSATDERTELEKQIGLVTINVSHATDDTTLTVAGEQLRRGAWGEPAPVMPGTTAIVLTVPGHKPLEASVTMVAGQTKSVDLDASTAAPLSSSATPQPEPTPTPETPSPSSGNHGLRTWAYVAGGVGAAGLLSFAIFGALASSKYNDLKNACGNAPCPPSRADDISTGKTDQTIANVSLALGIVGVAAGATLFVISIPKKNDAPAPQTSLVVGPGSLGLRGTF